jgi:hypothetical protein
VLKIRDRVLIERHNDVPGNMHDLPTYQIMCLVIGALDGTLQCRCVSECTRFMFVPMSFISDKDVDMKLSK